MLRPAMNDILEEGQSYYSFVIAVAKRARDMAEAAEARDEKLTQKPVKLAVESFADGEVDFREPKNL